MGYCINQGENTVFRMTRKNSLKALQAIKRLAGNESIHDGSGAHFSWVNTEEFVNAKTFKAAMDEWRWEVTEASDGSIDDISFRGEKAGDDMTLFDAIAPFVDPGSYIEMVGEDGAHWKWVFDGKKCKEVYGKVVYEE